MGNIKVVSLDLDGTIVDRSYVDYFWNVLIPRRYAEVHNIKEDEATRIVLSEYDNVGSNDIRWYEVEYWINKFKLNIDAKRLVLKAVKRAYIYPEVYDVVPRIAEKYTLVIATNADLIFAETLLLEKGFLKYFKRIFSCVTHLKLTRKTHKFYKWMCEELNVRPQEVVHVGDNPVYDLEIPREMGINAYLLDRDGRFDVRFRLRDLRELRSLLVV